MLGIMLIELWERLRGYDKWVKTEAMVESSQLTRIRHVGEEGSVYYTEASDCTLFWTDDQCKTQTASFNVPADSALYQLIGGERVSIRYDPSRPERFYVPALLRSRFGAIWRMTRLILLLLLLVVPFLLFRLLFR